MDFMDGVRVLNETQVLSWEQIGIAWFSIICVIMCVAVAISEGIEQGRTPVIICCMIGIVLSIVVFGWTTTHPKEKNFDICFEGEKPVSFVEFSKKYEVTGQRGEVYTIKIKGAE